MFHLKTKTSNKFYLYIFLLYNLIYPNLSRNVGPQVDPGKNDDKNSVLMHVIQGQFPRLINKVLFEKFQVFLSLLISTPAEMERDIAYWVIPVRLIKILLKMILEVIAMVSQRHSIHEQALFVAEKTQRTKMPINLLQLCNI